MAKKTQRAAIKMRQIQYFLEVSKQGHFSHAAEALFVTQPTLSHQIGVLESQIGTPLFDRAGKNVRLTEAGEVFRAYAARALTELEAGQQALDELEGLQRGLLRIGVSQSFVRNLLPPILRQFSGDHPSIHLHVFEMTANQIEHQLGAGQIDIGIAFAPTVLEETELEPLIEERLLLVASKKHAFAHRRHVETAELDDRPMALFSRDFSTRRLLDQFFGQAGANPKVVCETNSINVMLAMVNRDILTVIPEGAFERNARLVAIPMVSPRPVRVSALLWAKHNFRTTAARSFAQSAREHFKTMLPLR